MLKKLKLRLALIIFCILTLLLTSAVTAISVFLIRSVRGQSEAALEVTLKNEGKKNPRPFFSPQSDEIQPEALPPDGSPYPESLGHDGAADFGLDTIAFKYDSGGNITETLSQSTDEDEITEGQLSAVGELINGETEGGVAEIDGISYRWRKAERGYGGIIALVGRQSEMALTRRILFVSIPAAVFGTLLFAVVALLLAHWAARPVEEAWERQKRFIADASHELKTPLTVITTNLELVMENGTETVESQKKWLGYIGAETGRMKKLVGELLWLARYDAAHDDPDEAGSSRTEKALPKVNLSDIVTDAALTFESAFYEAGVTFESDVGDDIFMRGNGSELRSLTAILLDNAVKNTDEGGKVSLRLNLYKNEIRLECENTGRGLSEEECEKVFERFWRADASRTRASDTGDTDGGFGLGLSIAKSIVQSHGGRIRAGGVTGKSALFTVVFPVLSD